MNKQKVCLECLGKGKIKVSLDEKHMMKLMKNLTTAGLRL